MRRMALLLAPMLCAAAPAAATFQVLDETAPTEISEDTVIFIDGHLVAHFVLDKQHTSVVADVTVPAAAQYDYALCGRITIARPDGQQEQRVVDGGRTAESAGSAEGRAPYECVQFAGVLGKESMFCFQNRNISSSTR